MAKHSVKQFNYLLPFALAILTFIVALAARLKMLRLQTNYLVLERTSTMDVDVKPSTEDTSHIGKSDAIVMDEQDLEESAPADSEIGLPSLKDMAGILTGLT